MFELTFTIWDVDQSKEIQVPNWGSKLENYNLDKEHPGRFQHAFPCLDMNHQLHIWNARQGPVTSVKYFLINMMNLRTLLAHKMSTHTG